MSIVLRVALFAIACLAACGRLRFDERGVRADGGDAGTTEDGARDAPDPDAGTGTFGTMQVGISTQNTGADRVWLSKFTVTDPALVQRLVVHVAATGGQGSTLRGVIYADAGGTPTALLATTAAVAVSSMQASWVPLALAAPASLVPGTYWLGTHNATAISIDYQSATGATRFTGDTFSDGADAAYGGGATTYNMELSIYAEYTR